MKLKIYDKITASKEQGTQWKTITVAFLGDSVTQGCFEVYKTGELTIDTVYSYKDAFSTKFREIMNLLYPSMRVNIVNAGISGDNAENGARRVDADALAFHPDLLVVSYGLNDAVSGGADGINAYAENLRIIFEKAQKQGCDVIYLTQNCMNTSISCHLNDPLLKDLAKQFADLQNNGVLKAYFEAGKKVAMECGALICDGYAVWEKLIQADVNVTELLSNKLNHPIKEYHTYIAAKLIEKILDINI